MTIGEALAYIRDALAPSSGEFAHPEAEEILTVLTGRDRIQLYLSKSANLSKADIEKIDTIISRRINHEPLAYILESAYFYDREFIVSPSVLIPRPDTEVLIEKILEQEPTTPQRFLDIGTGSGIISSILTEHRPWKAMALDISVDALRIAKRNRRSSFDLVCSDLFSAIKPAHQFDFIVSNPPYIDKPSLNNLDSDVKEFEPHCALYGGDDGLFFYRQFAAEAVYFIKKDGFIYCEIGYDQLDSCHDIFALHHWRNISVTFDLNHHPRVISAKVPERENV
ncbi:MAG TPA: peptide chain release factor N(5)-glutamine methyltransferase [Chitinispirillaceae bacterium]|nr:peptide chain release factor N(5)-glutamine methyltransferase [Chitinispirillaceae bacterium]